MGVVVWYVRNLGPSLALGLGCLVPRPCLVRCGVPVVDQGWN